MIFLPTRALRYVTDREERKKEDCVRGKETQAMRETERQYGEESKSEREGGQTQRSNKL